MNVVHYILATAGHVDHGKSALVRGLTGIDPDRLPEEKARGITIELGFAHLDLPAPSDPQTLYRIGMIDVPGHEDFVKNMVAGVGSIDLALLVVSAREGWMPQTEEHLQILIYAGITHGIVALTMADQVHSTEPVIADVLQQLRGTPLADAPIVVTSAVNGIGLSDLKSSLACELSRVPPQRDLGKPRLAVDRAFVMRGVGTVVTGTLSGGTFRRGQSALVQPHGISARIRSIQSYNRDVELAVPGSRVALNLPDLQVGHSGHGNPVVSRGDVITVAELGPARDTVDIRLEMSSRRNNAKPLKDAARIRVHHGSGNFPATAHLLGTDALAPGQNALAQLRLESPLFALVGDRFIVRDWSERQTLAGGIVLDANAPRRGFRTPQRRQFLQERANAPTEPRAFVMTEVARDGAAGRSSLLIKSRFDQSQIDAATSALIKSNAVLKIGDWLADTSWWERLRRNALQAIDTAHRTNPHEPGIRLTELRDALGRPALGDEIFELLIEDLCLNGCIRSGAVIGRLDHRPALPANLQAAGKRISSKLSAKPLEPPSRKELAPDALSQAALLFLLRSGEAVAVGDELVLNADHYRQAVAIIRAHIQNRGAASVSELRQVLSTSRRVMVPLLEKLDREGVTVRQGDRRVLRPEK